MVPLGQGAGSRDPFAIQCRAVGAALVDDHEAVITLSHPRMFSGDEGALQDEITASGAAYRRLRLRERELMRLAPRGPDYQPGLWRCFQPAFLQLTLPA